MSTSFGRRSLHFIQVLSVCCALFAGSLNSEEQLKSELPNDTEPPKASVVASVDMEAILNSTPDAADYAVTRNCIASRSIRDHEVLNNRMIVFKMKNGDNFLVALDRECRGIANKRYIRTDPRGSLSLCKGDTLRGIVSDFGRETWGPPCYIPGFEPVTEHQIALLKEGIQSGRVE